MLTPSLSLGHGILLGFFLSLCLVSSRTDTDVTEVKAPLVRSWARKFAKLIVNQTANVATQIEYMKELYSSKNGVTVEKYDPEEILQTMSERIRLYLEKKTAAIMNLVENAEGSYVTYQYGGLDDECKDNLDDIYDSKCFFRYFAARCNHEYNDNAAGDGCGECPTDCVDDRVNIFGPKGVECRNDSVTTLECSLNGRFFGQAVNRNHSAIHVPTLIYERDPDLLAKIRWTGYSVGDDRQTEGFFDRTVRSNLEKDNRLGFQFFCSTTGFLRFYPATNWNFEAELDKYDKFDCRLTPWYNNAAMSPKLMIILVDISGSMYGQRFELAKKLIEMILKTMSENDYFNILLFNQSPKWASDCLADRLVQATARNKRVLMKSVKNQKSLIGGMAKFPEAFREAFNILRSSNCEELSNQTEAENTTCYLEDIMDSIQSTKNDFKDLWPCNQAIMLITDGAADTYSDVFHELNPDKRVRLFTYLIGLEAHEAPNVRSMACENRGHFVHIANDADIQANIHHYVNRMSRPLAMHRINTPVWSSIYFDQLTDGIVTTVSAPVFDAFGDDVSNYTVLGVVGTSVTTLQLERLAPKYLLGANAYTFMVNNNGYVMFHPRFRPLVKTEKHGLIYKPTYNSIDILEVEVTEDRIELNNASQVLRTLNYNDNEMRTNLVKGVKGKQGPDRLLLIADDKRRLYKMKRTIYYQGIDSGSSTIPFSLGIGIPENSTHRILLKKSLQEIINSLKASHFEGSNWVVHEHWEYCQWNDEESDKQEHFKDYLFQILQSKSLPAACSDDLWLMQHVLFDFQMSHELEQKWLSNQQLKPDQGVFLTFVSTRSGLTRYVDIDQQEIIYEAPTTPTPSTENNATVSEPEEAPEPIEPQPGYIHFIQTRNNSIDNPYYKRALYAPAGTWVFDVDTNNRVWKTKQFESVYGLKENFSVIVTARQAVYTEKGNNKAPAAVVGFEMSYDSFAQMMMEASDNQCQVNNTENYSCYLVDYHGYVLFTSNPIQYGNPKELREYFGDIEPGVMNEIVSANIYIRQIYIDYQALCQNETLDSSGLRLLSPLYNIVSAISWAWKELVMFFLEYSVWSLFSGWIWPVQSFSDFYTYDDIGMSCDEFLPFYTLNKDAFVGQKAQSFQFSYPCSSQNDAMICTKGIGVAMIPSTSMLLVVIKSSAECLDSRCEMWSVPADLNFTQTVSMQASVAYGASDKLYKGSLNWRDQSKKDEHTSAEVLDTEPTDKPPEKAPSRCNIKSRTRRPPNRQCVWFHANATYDDRFSCSQGYQLSFKGSLLTALLVLLSLTR